MKTKNVLIAAAVLGAMVSASAGATTWDFFALSGGVAKDLGTSASFTQGTDTIAASVVPPGATVNQTMVDLYAKNGGPAETGLGLTPNGDKEIFYPNGIKLVLTGGSMFSSVLIGSVQGSESWDVQGWNGTSWVDIKSGVGGGTSVNNAEINVTNLSAYTQIIVDTPYANGTNGTNGNNNIVLESAVTTNTVPEPAMLGLLGIGLAGLGVMRRRQSKG